MYDIIRTTDGTRVEVDGHICSSAAIGVPAVIMPFEVAVMVVNIRFGELDLWLDRADAAQLIHDLVSVITEDDDRAEAVWRSIA